MKNSLNFVVVADSVLVAMAAITKCQDLSGLKKSNLFFPNSGS